jgi:hypothetical protein
LPIPAKIVKNNNNKKTKVYKAKLKKIVLFFLISSVEIIIKKIEVTIRGYEDKTAMQKRMEDKIKNEIFLEFKYL